MSMELVYEQFGSRFLLRLLNDRLLDRNCRRDTLLLREDHLIYKQRLYDIAEAHYD